MTQHITEHRVNVAMAMLDALVDLEGVYAMQGSAGNVPPDSVVAAVVRGYIAAWEGLIGKEAVPAKPKQKRARRKKADMVALAAEAINA